MAEIDPYAVLGVPRTATRDEVARAYRALAKRHHPDAGAPPSASMARINEAWSILGSPGRRASWDRAHAVVRAPHWAAAPPRAPQRPERPVAPPPSRLDSGWAAFGVVTAVVLLVGVSMIVLSLVATPSDDRVAFESSELRFRHLPEWTVAAGDGSDPGGHRVVAHLVTFDVDPGRLCTTFEGPCALEPDDIPPGEASIVITAWEGGEPPVPEPVTARPAGLSADAIIAGRPAAIERRVVDEDIAVTWYQLSPPDFPDRWIEVTAVVRGLELDRTDVLDEITRLLDTVEFRD
jgi:hypothetical protein